MYAVIKTGGKQYKVAENSRVRVEKIDLPVGERFELDDVQLLIADNAAIVTDASHCRLPGGRRSGRARKKQENPCL